MTAQQTVLIVDDDQDIVGFLEEAIDLAGYRAVSTMGAAALPLVEALRPAVILLDLQMPGMSGEEICRRLKGDPATAAIPIVVMSALDRLTATASHLPADDRLPKPFDLAHLYAAIERWSARAGSPQGAQGKERQ